MIVLYNPSDAGHGLLLGQWWAYLYTSGDIVRMFPVQTHSIQQLYKLYEPPTTLYIDWDEKGIWFASWYSPSLGGVFHGLWIAPRRRHSLGCYRNTMAVYDIIFDQYPIVMGITIHENLLRAHEKLGYKVVGIIPKIFDGQDAWLVTLTKEDFYGHRVLSARGKVTRYRRERNGDAKRAGLTQCESAGTLRLVR